jgi:hypothetical protein
MLKHKERLEGSKRISLSDAGHCNSRAERFAPYRRRRVVPFTAPARWRGHTRQVLVVRDESLSARSARPQHFKSRMTLTAALTRGVMTSPVIVIPSRRAHGRTLASDAIV